MIALARLADIPDPGAIVVTSAGPALIVARRGGDAFAYRNVCPHAGYPLQRADGAVLVQEGRYIVCGAHGASFELDTGACAGGPCDSKARLVPVAVIVRDGTVWLAA